MIEKTFFYVSVDYPSVFRACYSAEDRLEARKNAKHIAFYESGGWRVVIYFLYRLPGFIANRYAEMGFEIALGLGKHEGLTPPKYFGYSENMVDLGRF